MAEAKFVLNGAPLAQPVVHFDFEEARHAAAGGLGAGECGVGIVEQRRCVGRRRSGKIAMPMLRPTREMLAVQFQIGGDGRVKAFGEDFGERRLIAVRRDEDEFVASEPRQIGVAGEHAQLLRKLAKHIVADRMAEHVVDLLEAVEVDAQHGEQFFARLCGADRCG